MTTITGSFGNWTIAGTITCSPDYNRGTYFTMIYPGSINNISLRLNGGGGEDTGSGYLQCAVYNYYPGSSLLGSTNIIPVTLSNPDGWVTFDFATPLGVTQGSYALVFNFGLSGVSDFSRGVSYNTVAKSSYEQADTFPISNTSIINGSAAFNGSYKWAIYATYNYYLPTPKGYISMQNNGSNITLPFISITDAINYNDDQTLRIGSAGVIYCADLIGTGSYGATALRVQTPKGMKAWRG